MTREELVKLARDTLSTSVHRPDYCENPASFDPHEWVLEAMAFAYVAGKRDGWAVDPTDPPTCPSCGSTVCLVQGHHT